MDRETMRDWRPVEQFVSSAHEPLNQSWLCDPAWDVVALMKGADAELPHPSDPEKKSYLFVNRHVDKRFTLTYPHTTREAPRPLSNTLADSDADWDVLEEHRDRYLADAGLTMSSPEPARAKCMADTFLWESYFGQKPFCTSFGEEKSRNICHPIEGLIHQAFCVGCAHALAALSESCDLDSRTIGCGAHRIAEVRVDDRWRCTDNGGRHQRNEGTIPAYYQSSYMEMYSDPMGDHGAEMTQDYIDGLWARPSGQYHFTGGTWQSDPTLRFAASNVQALYPEAERCVIKAATDEEMPIVLNQGGYYMNYSHDSYAEVVSALRRATLPAPLHPESTAIRDYVYSHVPPGGRLRQSVWLDDPDDLRGLVVKVGFAPTTENDFSEGAGRQLTVQAGDFDSTLTDLNAWPPKDPENGEPLVSAFVIPVGALLTNDVNWIELHQNSASPYLMPFVPAIKEPYIPPLLLT